MQFIQVREPKTGKMFAIDTSSPVAAPDRKGWMRVGFALPDFTPQNRSRHVNVLIGPKDEKEILGVTGRALEECLRFTTAIGKDHYFRSQLNEEQTAAALYLALEWTGSPEIPDPQVIFAPLGETMPRDDRMPRPFRDTFEGAVMSVMRDGALAGFWWVDHQAVPDRPGLYAVRFYRDGEAVGETRVSVAELSRDSAPTVAADVRSFLAVVLGSPALTA